MNARLTKQGLKSIEMKYEDWKELYERALTTIKLSDEWNFG